MPICIKFEKNPNNEIRLTMFNRKTHETQNETGADTPGFGCPSEVGENSDSTDVLCDRPLTLSFAPSSKPSCNAHSYGRTRFGLDARRALMRAGGALDRYDPEPSNYLFLTGTLPGETEWAKWAMAEYANYAVNTLKAWIAKLMPNKLDFYVWEHQKRSALHLHYCLHCPDKAVQKYILEHFRSEWIRILDSISKQSQICMFEKLNNTCWLDRNSIVRATAEVVRKSVAAYLSCYTGGTKDKHRGDKYRPYYPKRWWGVSRPLKALVESMTERLEKQYSSYRDANEAFMKMREDLLHGAVKETYYRHKVGIGQTSASYHPTDTIDAKWKETMGRKSLETLPNGTATMIQSMGDGLTTLHRTYKAGLIKRPILSLRVCRVLDAMDSTQFDYASLTPKQIVGTYQDLTSRYNVFTGQLRATVKDCDDLRKTVWKFWKVSPSRLLTPSGYWSGLQKTGEMLDRLEKEWYGRTTTERRTPFAGVDVARPLSTPLPEPDPQLTIPW